MKRARVEQAILIVTFVAFSWLAMQVVHECGHIAVSLGTGTEIIQVTLHPLRVSETEVWEPPHPLAEVWAGPISGVVLPLVAYGIARWLRIPCLYLFRFFAGFCLVANGVYVGFGPSTGGADTAVMVLHGSPRWLMLLFGVPCATLGLFLWHRQGKFFGLGEAGGQVERRAVITSAVLLVGLVIAELAGNEMYRRTWGFWRGLK